MTIPHTIYFGLINFVLLTGALVLLLRRPVRDFLATRAALLRKAVDEAAAGRAAAETRAREYAGRLARIEDEMAALQRQYEEEGRAERALIVQRAEEYAAKLAADTERMIGQELKRAKEQLRGTTVDLAILMAERYLREQMGPEDQARLAQLYVERLEHLQ